MERALLHVLCLLIAVVTVAQQPQTSPPAIPTLDGGSLPIYPQTARLARIEGTVVLRVSTDGEKVSSVSTVIGPVMLARAAEQTIKSWHFESVAPSTFESIFKFHLESGCGTSKTVIALPVVEITGYVNNPYDCDPNFGLDLSEPLRVFFTKCESDGHVEPCSDFKIVLSSSDVTVSPDRFADSGGKQGFVVPKALRKSEKFTVTVDSRWGRLSIADLDKSRLRGNWHLVIDHRPFQEEWSYLAKQQDCLGIIHFVWGEPETLAVTDCSASAVVPRRH